MGWGIALAGVGGSPSLDDHIVIAGYRITSCSRGTLRSEVASMNRLPNGRFPRAGRGIVTVADPIAARAEQSAPDGPAARAWTVLGAVGVLVASCLYYVVYVALMEHARH
jgi:hypothetical protein